MTGCHRQTTHKQLLVVWIAYVTVFMCICNNPLLKTQVIKRTMKQEADIN